MAAAHHVCEDVVTVKAFRSPSLRPTSTSWPKSLEVGRNSSNYLHFSVLAPLFHFCNQNFVLKKINFKAKKHMSANGKCTLNLQVYSEG